MPASPSAPAPGLRTLVAGLVDYAGLFPPASLSMRAAADTYHEHLVSRESWMLGRFVVPVPRLGELAEQAGQWVDQRVWRLATLVGADPAADAARIAEFNSAQRGRFVIDAVEGKGGDADAVTRLARAFGDALVVYVELPHESDPGALLEVVRLEGARAKIRTGGVVAGAIPSVLQVARFIARCAAAPVPFKATAGLHHPLRGDHRLTYEPDAPFAIMFGFVNVFMAAALALASAGEEELAAVLDEREAAAFHFDDMGASWRDRRLSLDDLSAARRFAVAFGSCSFREPVDDLEELALL